MNATFPLEDFQDDFDPFTALLKVAGESHIEDPYPALVELRKKRGTVLETDLSVTAGATRWETWEPDRPLYAVLGFEEVSQVLLDNRNFSNSVYQSTLGITFGKSVTTMDPPDHTRYRGLFQPAFTPRMLEKLRLSFQQVLDRLFANFEKRGSADLVGELALHFPFQFIMDLMSMPAEQRTLFHKLAAAQACVSFDPEHSVEASRILGNYLSPLIDERRANGGDDDFVGVMARAEVDGQQLPQEIIIAFFRQLMNAGGDTSYHGFSNILTALFTHPEQLDEIRQDRSLIKQAIEEGLRWEPPLPATIIREAINTVEIGGIKIPAGAAVQLALGVANRDEQVWENPERFDIHRTPKRHLAFGYGPHICIGQHLARLELTMALNQILDRLPDVRLDPDKPAPQILGFTMRGAHSVHVVFDV